MEVKSFQGRDAETLSGNVFVGKICYCYTAFWGIHGVKVEERGIEVDLMVIAFPDGDYLEENSHATKTPLESRRDFAVNGKVPEEDHMAVHAVHVGSGVA